MEKKPHTIWNSQFRMIRVKWIVWKPHADTETHALHVKVQHVLEKGETFSIITCITSLIHHILHASSWASACKIYCFYPGLTISFINGVNVLSWSHHIVWFMTQYYIFIFISRFLITIWSLLPFIYCSHSALGKNTENDI